MNMQENQQVRVSCNHLRAIESHDFVVAYKCNIKELV